jgi:hypothetical protein
LRDKNQNVPKLIFFQSEKSSPECSQLCRGKSVSFLDVGEENLTAAKSPTLSDLSPNPGPRTTPLPSAQAPAALANSTSSFNFNGEFN